jgi:hypothetical protein
MRMATDRKESGLTLGGRPLSRAEVFQGAMVAGSLGGAATIGVVSAQEVEKVRSTTLNAMVLNMMS